MSGEKPQRLDLALVDRSLVPSRSRARDLIKQGAVIVNGAAASKPSAIVSGDDVLSLSEGAWHYVSRSALKLSAALDAFEVAVEGRTAIDIGASTGGFTQVLLERGSAHVTAVDVGHGQLVEELRSDPRVTSFEGLDARALTQDHLAEQERKTPDLIVADVSFISLTKVLEGPMKLVSKPADLIALIKPQFEAGRKAVGAGGIVRDKNARAKAVSDVQNWIADQPGWSVRETIEASVPGQHGNQEYLVWASSASQCAPPSEGTDNGAAADTEGA